MRTLTHTYTHPVMLQNGVLLQPGQTVTVDDACAAACLALAPQEITDAPVKPLTQKEK